MNHGGGGDGSVLNRPGSGDVQPSGLACHRRTDRQRWQHTPQTS